MKSRALVVLLGLVGALVVLLVASALRRPEPSPVVVVSREVPRTELALVGERLRRTNESEPFTGVMLDHYPDGSRRSRSAVSNGVLQGLSEGWYTNGVLQIRESFVAGVSHGIRTKWSSEGTPVSEAVIENGRIEGKFRRWHPSGGIAEEIEMRNNEPEGMALAYHEDGTIKARVQMSAGNVVKRETWKPGEHPVTPAPSRTSDPGK